jgi:DNA polymerase-3 subunit epsilon/ATP-dependent DNA helicase DinG
VGHPREELRVLSKILIWLPNTLNGDGDELFLPTAQEWAVWAHVSAIPENCNVRDCPYYEAGECFFYRARERAAAAHLVVVNHALLLADVAAQNRVLPDYSYLIVDEAHHLENATTESLHFSIDWYALRYSLDELLRGHGSFPSLMETLQGVASRLPREVRVLLEEAAVRLEDVGELTMRRFEELFGALDVFLEENVNGGQRTYAARLRIVDSLRTQPSWDRVEVLWSVAAEPAAVLVDGLRRLSGGLEELSTVSLPELDAPRSQMLAINQRLAEVYAQLKTLFEEPSKDTIYWLEKDYNRGTLSLQSVPLQIGPLVRESLFKKKKSVVLTSATLRIAGSFDYIRQRLEAREAAELAVGSPFDYESAVLLYVANDIPEPGRPGYQGTLERALLSLFAATKGRAMALFTSYSQLHATAQAIAGPLARLGITVHPRGVAARGRSCWRISSAKKSPCSWERDPSGRAWISRRCALVSGDGQAAFDVPDDPIVAARSEMYEDAFNEYMVPKPFYASFRVWPLIRTRTDRGVVAVLDGRLLTKRYGRRFLDSLPGPTVRVGSSQKLAESAASWLGGKPLPAEPAADEPWSVPPPEEPDWFWVLRLKEVLSCALQWMLSVPISVLVLM